MRDRLKEHVDGRYPQRPFTCIRTRGSMVVVERGHTPKVAREQSKKVMDRLMATGRKAQEG